MGKLELKSAHPPHYKTGTVLCSLQVKDKFTMFVRDTFDPFTFFSIAFDAGLDHSSNRDPSFGQGASGYGKTFRSRLRPTNNVPVSVGFRVSDDFFRRPQVLPPAPRQWEAAFLPCSRAHVCGAARQWQACVQCLEMAGNCEFCASQ